MTPEELNKTIDLQKTSDSARLSEDKKSVVIIDQTKLPNSLEYLTINTPKDLFDAIFHLKVRGAPAIGIAAGYGIYCLALNFPRTSYEDFYEEFKKQKAYMNSSRPTAVNLSWALGRMEGVVTSNSDKSIDDILALLLVECESIHREDIEMCRAISENGLSVLKDGDGVLTHCNAGPLATSRYGTAIGPLILGKEQGFEFRAFADETRPLLQGARLTTYELYNAGVDVTLICDNMASIVMKSGQIQACFVGCDRVAANGDAANKIGTSGVAILAKHYGIPFYVLGPSSTFDLNCKTGEDIEIEQRAPEEIKTKWYSKPMAPKGVKCYNPAFDVTDNSLIAGIITEKGILRAPYTKSIKKMFDK